MNLIELNADFHACKMKAEGYLSVAKSLHDDGDTDGATEYGLNAMYWAARMVELGGKIQLASIDALKSKGRK